MSSCWSGRFAGLLCVVSIVLLDRIVKPENGSAECFNTSKSISLDPKFLASLRTIYYPIQHQTRLYRTAADLQRNNKRPLSTPPDYYDSCVTWSIQPNGSVIAMGFGNLVREYQIVSILPNLQKFTFRPVDGEGHSGTGYVTLTDNKAFFVVVLCADDGERLWTIFSKEKSLPREIMDRVRGHVIWLGFKREDIIELKYDNCSADSTIKLQQTTPREMEEATTAAVTEHFEIFE